MRSADRSRTWLLDQAFIDGYQNIDAYEGVTMKLSPAEFLRIARALADPQRLEILERAAARGELSCASIVGELSVTQATISHHLKELSTAGLLERRKEGQFAHYRFCPEVMSAYLAELERRMRLSPGDRPAG